MTESVLGVWLQKAFKQVLKMNYAINAQRFTIDFSQKVAFERIKQ